MKGTDFGARSRRLACDTRLPRMVTLICRACSAFPAPLDLLGGFFKGSSGTKEALEGHDIAVVVIGHE